MTWNAISQRGHGRGREKIVFLGGGSWRRKTNVATEGVRKKDGKNLEKKNPEKEGKNLLSRTPERGIKKKRSRLYIQRYLRHRRNKQ